MKRKIYDNKRDSLLDEGIPIQGNAKIYAHRQNEISLDAHLYVYEYIYTSVPLLQPSDKKSCWTLVMLLSQH